MPSIACQASSTLRVYSVFVLTLIMTAVLWGNAAQAASVRLSLNLSEQKLPQTLELPLPQGQTVKLEKIHHYVNRLGRTVWVGRQQGQTSNATSILIIEGSHVHGQLLTEHGIYRLTTSNQQQEITAVAPLIQTKLAPTMAEDEAIIDISASSQTLYSQLAAAQKQSIQVLTVISEASNAEFGDTLHQDLDAAYIQLQESLRRQNLDQALEFVEVARSNVSFSESTSVPDTLQRLVLAMRHPDNEIRRLREQHQADLVIYIGVANDYCGQAATIKAKYDRSIAYVNANCMQTPVVLAHELGHLMGARHNIEEDPFIFPYPWGHGTNIDTVQAEYRSIMAYASACNDSSCSSEIMTWSDPDFLVYGTPAGNPETAHVARVLREAAPQIAQLYETYGAAPKLSILAPTQNAILLAEQLHSFSAQATDDNDGDLSDSVSWHSDQDGALSNPSLLSVGEHVITAQVFDSDGYYSSQQVNVSVHQQAVDLAAQLIGADGKWRNGSISFEAQVANLGPSTADQVVLDINWPEVLQLQSVNTATGQCHPTTGQLRCTWAGLASDQTETVTITVATDDAKTKFLFSAAVSNQVVDPRTSNDQSHARFGGALGDVLLWLGLLGLLRLTIDRQRRYNKTQA